MVVLRTGEGPKEQLVSVSPGRSRGASFKSHTPTRTVNEKFVKALEVATNSRKLHSLARKHKVCRQ